jgi:SnoaL-like domain
MKNLFILPFIIIAIHFSLFHQAWGQEMESTNIESIKRLYHETTIDNMKPVLDFYDTKIIFQDPVGKHQGRDALLKYYEGLYKNVKEIKFEFSSFIENGNTVVAIWTMTLRADKLNNGNSFTVDGNSVITFNSLGKAIFHRDYFDMGEFIYERIPVIGFLTKKIKNRLKN